MKNTITLLICMLLAPVAFADTGTPDDLELNTEKVSVQFSSDKASVVLNFTDQPDSAFHCVIDIKRINDLEYKTRVMRYFGGLLVNNTYQFKSLVVMINGERQEYEWNRSNVSIIVNKICDQAQQMM